MDASHCLWRLLETEDVWDDWSHEASSSKALDEPEGDTGGEVEAGVSRTCCHDCWVFVGVSAEVSGSFMTDDRDWELMRQSTSGWFIN